MVGGIAIISSLVLLNPGNGILIEVIGPILDALLKSTRLPNHVRSIIVQLGILRLELQSLSQIPVSKTSGQSA